MRDAMFSNLPLSTRSDILSQIDPKFAKMNSRKQDAFLWNAETKYLPKASPPKETFAWSAIDPNSTSQLLHVGRLGSTVGKTIKANDLVVQASLEEWVFPVAHLQITNGTSQTISVHPSTFLLYVRKPKQRTLFFEYPSRVEYQIFMMGLRYSPSYTPTQRTTVRSANGGTVATVDSPDQAAKQDLNHRKTSVFTASMNVAGTIEPKALKDGPLLPGASTEGEVYFEDDSKAQDLMLKVFLADVAFEIPFSLPKRR